jgi:hypothetical protein
MSRTAHIGDMHTRFVPAKSEILFFITMREDRVFTDGAMHDARVVTERKPFGYAHDIAPEHLAAGRSQQVVFSISDPVR